MTLQFLSLVLGPLLVAIYLPAMLYPKEAQKVVKAFVKEEILARAVGAALFLVGMVILNTEYRISQDWEALIVLMGYGCVIEGLVYMWWPSSMKKIAGKASVQSCGLMSAIGFIVGIALCYLGAYVY